MYAIQVENAEKLYKNGVYALNNLSLTVKKGEIYSLLGQNGSGKSTLISILTTYLKASGGRISILGKDILENPNEIRSQIACVSQMPSIYTHLSLEENMMFQARLYKTATDEAKHRMLTLIEEFELKDCLKYPIKSYSGGIKRRVDIAVSMMSKPEILFLDEPTVGMDLQSRIVMWEMMKKIRDDFSTTIFLTTHYLEEADNISDTICIIKKGKEIVQASPFELRNYIQQDTIKIQFFNKDEAKKTLSLLTRYFPQLSFNLKDEKIFINTNSHRISLLKISQFLVEFQINFQALDLSKATLDDIFLQLTQNKEFL